MKNTSDAAGACEKRAFGDMSRAESCALVISGCIRSRKIVTSRGRDCLRPCLPACQTLRDTHYVPACRVDAPPIGTRDCNGRHRLKACGFSRVCSVSTDSVSMPASRVAWHAHWPPPRSQGPTAPRARYANPGSNPGSHRSNASWRISSIEAATVYSAAVRPRSRKATRRASHSAAPNRANIVAGEPVTGGNLPCRRSARRRSHTCIMPSSNSPGTIAIA